MELNNDDNTERKPPNKDQLDLEVSRYRCGSSLVTVILDEVGRSKIKYRLETDPSRGEKAR